MTQMELARELGISGGYLWKIYHGYARPSEKLAKRMRKSTGKTAAWWNKARLADIQKLLDRLQEV